MMEKSNFDKLLDRYVNGQTSQEENEKLEAWLDVKKTEIADEDVTEEEEERLFHKITGNLKIDEFRRELPKRTNKINRRLLAIAAAVALIISVTAIILLTINDNVEKLILNDGTIVWVKNGGTLTYYEIPGDEHRYAELKGEALFEVSKDPLRPFIIRCGDTNVTVVGTSFNIRMEGDGLHLAVLTGKVKVSSTLDSTGMMVGARENVVFSSKGPVRSEALSASEVQTVVGHTQYNMEFTDSSMEEILKRVEEKFSVTVNLSNQNINRCRVTADFTDQSLDRTLEMLADVLDLSYQIESGVVHINGSGCK